MGHLSASDMCELTYGSNFNAIVSMSVHEFMVLLASDGHENQAPVCVTADTKLLECARKMIDRHIHKLWTIASDNEIQNYGTGCVSLTDVIHAVNADSTVLMAGDYIL